MTGGQAQSRIHTALYRRTACPAGIDDALQLVDGRQTPVTLICKIVTRLIELIDELGLGRAIETPGARDAILIGGPGKNQILIRNRAIVGFLLPHCLLPGTARRTTDIVIERDGRVTVRPPLRLTSEQVDQTVHGKRLWIHRNLAEWRALNARTVSREWVAGESFLYLGRHYRLRLVSDQAEPLLLKEGRFCLRRDVLE